jgi:hypothetical protein
MCLAIAGCGDYATTTTTESLVAARTTSTPAGTAAQAPGNTAMPAPATTIVAVTHQSPVAAYGSVFSALVAVAIALSGTFAFLRLPRLKLAHDPDNVPEDVVPGSECEWWWRVRVVNANRSWGLFVPRTAKGVEVFVTSLRRTHDADGNRVESDDSLDMPVVSGRRIPWTIPRKDKKADPDGIAPVSIPAGTFRYLSAIGPRYTGDGEARTRRAFYALHLKPGTTAGRYDIDQRQGIWVAKLVVSADDVRARRWRITIRLAAPSDSEDRPKDAVTLTLSSSQAVRS